MLRRALSLESDRWPSDDARVLRPQRLLGACLINLRRLDEAEPILLDAYRILAASWGASNEFTISAANVLVSLYELWGRPADAARYRPGTAGDPGTPTTADTDSPVMRS